MNELPRDRIDAATAANSPPANQSANVKRDSRGASASATAFLDTIRFIAANLLMLSHILLVFFDHKVAYQGGGVAVIILFVLSGFLITRSLMYRASKPGAHMAEFLADRVARIMTPLVPVLLIIALLNAALIHTNWSLDGLSTGVPIQFWIYIAAGLLVFGVLLREKIRPGYIWVLALISVPVVIWNAADDAGKSLSLVWMAGGLAGFLIVHMGTDSKAARSKTLPLCLLVFGSAALAARIVDLGFDPYDLQTAFLMIVIFFAVFLRLNQATTAWKSPAALAKFFASYSYSLYLVHNTVLVIVFENTAGLPKAGSIAIGVVLAHAAALLVYHAFEKRHRAVGSYLRPIFSRYMMRSDAASSPVSEVGPETSTISNRA